MKSLRPIGLFLLTAIFALASGEAAAKTYYRSCSARYEVRVTQVDGVPVTMPTRHVSPGFTGTGKCGPYTRINDCRRRARDFCHTCMSEHWAHRSTTPAACTYFAGGVGVRSYSIHDLTDALNSTACSTSDFRHGASIRYDVYRVTTGDKGCGGGTAKTMSKVLGYATTECR